MDSKDVPVPYMKWCSICVEHSQSPVHLKLSVDDWWCLITESSFMLGCIENNDKEKCLHLFCADTFVSIIFDLWLVDGVQNPQVQEPPAYDHCDTVRYLYTCHWGNTLLHRSQISRLDGSDAYLPSIFILFNSFWPYFICNLLALAFPSIVLKIHIHLPLFLEKRYLMCYS
jgi:hypothetical protein